MMNRSVILLVFVMLVLGCGNPSQAQQGTAQDTEYLGAVTRPNSIVVRQQYPYDFVSVSDVIPDVQLDIRYYTSNNFVGRHIPGYEAPKALLPKAVADSLRAVADELRFMGYGLKIYDAYRPQKAVDAFMQWVADPKDTLMRQQYYPRVPKSRMVGKYIARRSAHTRGAAVDLTLVDLETGQELDMGGTFDWFGEESRPTYCGDPDRMIYQPRKGGISEQQFKHRMMLRQAMTAHGFRAIKSEWWHFSLKNEPYPRTYFNFDIR